MKRNSLALAAGIALALGSSAVVTADASFVNTSAAAMLQGQATSRWQPDRFGPIVSSDTLWSIAMYYGDKTDLSVYEMMDLFIELNPEAFINGRADRMMDGYYLKVPKIAQQTRAEAAVVAESATPTTTPVDSTAAEKSNAVEPAPASAETTQSTANTAGNVEFNVAELTQLRTQLSESISLIERLNSENSQLQERLDSVTAELEQLRLKVNAEQVAEDELQDQIAAEIIATRVEAGDAATVANETPVATETPSSTAVEQAQTPQSTDTQATTAPETAEGAVSEGQVPEPVVAEPQVAVQTAAEPKAAEPKPVKRKQQSEYQEFIDWLLQPFQLTLAILIPLLLAAIIWYVLYVRRLNRETLGPYNGAMQAAEQEQQQEQGEAETKLSAYEEAEQAALAEEAADMPDFERLDEDEEVSAEAPEDATPEALEDELSALDSDDEFETIDETVDNEADLDTLLATSFDEPEPEPEPETETETETEIDSDVESAIETTETELEAEADADDDLSLEFETTSVSSEKPQTESKSEQPVSTDDDEMSLDFHIDDATAEADIDAVPATDETPIADLEVELEQFEDVDLDDIDLEALSAETETKTETADDNDDDGAFLEIDALLEEAESAESDYDSPRFERESGQVDDNEETPSGMIDLARAYLEMDEYELARSELEKVAQTDDDDAKREAAMLLQKIEEQGH